MRASLESSAADRRTSRPVLVLTDASLGDPALVARALTGDKWAEGAIYTRYAPLVVSFAARLLGRRADALDVLQDVFVDALRDLPTLREPSALRGWLMTRTLRQVQRRFRRRKVLRALGLDRGIDDATLEEIASPLASAETRTELARVSRVLDGRPVRERMAWMLHRVEGESLPEIAASLGCSLATVKRDIARVSEAVRSAIDEET